MFSRRFCKETVAWFIICLTLAYKILVMWLRLTGFNSVRLCYTIEQVEYQPLDTNTLQPRPKAWLPDTTLRGDGHNKAFFVRIADVLRRSGFYFGDESSTSWRLMHGFTNKMHRAPERVPVPQENQKVNYMPGLKVITSKHKLLSANITGMLPSFRLPAQRKQFKEYVGMHPNTQWISKDRYNFGKGTKLIKDIDWALKTLNPLTVQKFVPDPFLIHGRSFIMSEVVLITSVNPLRVYLLNNIQTRIHLVPYYPFDPENRSKYITEGDQLFFIEFLDPLSELSIMYNKTSSSLLLDYIKVKGHNPEEVQNKIKRQILNVFIESKDKIVLKAKEALANSRGYYEIVRFDFFLDSDLNPHLTEVQSPPMMVGSVKTTRQDTEKSIHDSLKLNGIIPSYPNNQHGFSGRWISGDPHLCLEGKCYDDCSSDECALCTQCMSKDNLLVLEETYLEHLRNPSFTRLIPQPFQSQMGAESYLDNETTDGSVPLKDSDKWLRMWFAAKCVSDNSWC